MHDAVVFRILGSDDDVLRERVLEMYSSVLFFLSKAGSHTKG